MTRLNYTKLLELQRKLDLNILKTHKVSNQEIAHKKNVALIVEFSEFTNELQDFKYWKKNKNINIDDIYEELSDVLHFIFSYYASNEEGCSNIETIDQMEPYDYSDNISIAFLRFNEVASKIVLPNGNINYNSLDESYRILLSIIDYFKLEYKKIEENYIRKNEINFERIKNNY